MRKRRNGSECPIVVVQGSQWGSEGKGGITAHICVTRNAQFCARTGGINAGHTVYYKGKPYKMQQLPVGWVNPDTRLILGPGAIVHPDILENEIAFTEAAIGVPGSVRNRLLIDYRAGVHLLADQAASSKANRHHSIGATGKGVSEAIAQKILGRGTPAGMNLMKWWDKTDRKVEWTFGDMVFLLNEQYDKGARIVIEATQGNLLDLHLGPWPYTTGKQTCAAAWLAECGLSPNLEYEIVSVVRTYPIRVAGNSGPMPGEISWPMLAQRINEKLAQQKLPPLVKQDSITAWQQAMAYVAARFDLPVWDGAGTAQHVWSRCERELYRVALSEQHAAALKRLEEFDPPALTDLKHLFEFTTVTHKLRRIAEISFNALRDSFMIDRPDYIALTFLNYEVPEVWGQTDRDRVFPNPRVRDYMNMITRETGVPIGPVSTGPLPEHILG